MEYSFEEDRDNRRNKTQLQSKVVVSERRRVERREESHQLSYRHRDATYNRRRRVNPRITQINPRENSEIEELRKELNSLKTQLESNKQVKPRVNVVLKKRDICPSCRRRLQHKFFKKFTESQWTGKNY